MRLLEWMTGNRSPKQTAKVRREERALASEQSLDGVLAKMRDDTGKEPRAFEAPCKEQDKEPAKKKREKKPRIGERDIPF